MATAHTTLLGPALPPASGAGFPTIAEASTEIIKSQAILNLPKGTEHFLCRHSQNMKHSSMC